MDDEFQGAFDTEGIRKNFLFVNRKAPYGTIYALEILETVLISAAFEQNVTVAFIDDGVFQIKKGQDTKAVAMKNFSPTYRIIEDEKEDADEDPDEEMVWRICVERESMEARGLAPDDLVIGVEVLGSDDMAALMEQHDVIISG